MRAMPSDKDTAPKPHAARPARPLVRNNGCKKRKTVTTSGGPTMCTGFNSGEQLIPATGADQPMTALLRYKIP